VLDFATLTQIINASRLVNFTTPPTQETDPLVFDGDFIAPFLFPLPGNNPYQDKFTIRADFFNLFNRVNFGKPVNAISSSLFGQSTDAFRPRIIQFVGRFDF